MNKKLTFVFLALVACLTVTGRERLNFNADWRLHIGDVPIGGDQEENWQRVTLPYAFNGNEAFRKDIVDLTDTVCWYSKKFVLTKQEVNGKVFIEFEGVRQGADFYLNGHHLGFSENGVMACGFDLTPYIKEGENWITAICDNSWNYRSRKHDSRYQWNDKNFNANYGGIPKNVWLHVTGKLHQTLPLYSDLGTTGTYVYANNFDIANRKAQICVESRGVNIVSAKAGYDTEHTSRSYDDNELSEWKNDGRLSTAWITYKLEKKAVVDDICLKLTGWRLRSYPLEVYAGKQLIWSGETERSLGYIHLKPSRQVKTDEITIRLKGAGKDKDAFGGITEVAQPAAGELDLFKAKNGDETNNELRIVEIELLESVD